MDSRNGKRMMAAACRYAYCRFALNYYMYGETLEGKPDQSQIQKSFQEQFYTLTGQLLKDQYPVEETDRLRNEIIKEMEMITAYIDSFRIYEYVLNRIEGRFKENGPAVYDEGETVDQIMQFIVSAKEPSQRNQRIKEILEQLPLRFTRSRFFAIASQALSIYEGTDKRSLEQVLYLLRSEAMLSLPDHMEEGHEELVSLLEEFRQADYRSLTATEFSRLSQCLTLAEEKLSALSSDCMMMIDLVNDFYVICLTRQETLMDSQEEELIRSIISAVYRKLGGEETEAGQEDLLVQMEGRQERYYEQWSRYEAADPEEIAGEGALAQDQDVLRRVGLLLSTSSFMSLDPEEEKEEVEEENILLSRKAVEELCQPFFQELEEAWKNLPKCVVRSIMAKLLAVLPMFFTTSDDIREFISGCLSACSDLSEKSASIELIQSIMEREDALV